MSPLIQDVANFVHNVKNTKWTSILSCHIVCAYNLPGPPDELHHLQDPCDDDETGAGSALLNAMVESDICCKAFFIVRYCGDIKL